MQVEEVLRDVQRVKLKDCFYSR